MASLSLMRMVLKSRPCSISMAVRRSSDALMYQHWEEGAKEQYDPKFPAGSHRRFKIEDVAVVAKEQGPWGELSKGEKVALYRHQFGKSMYEEKHHGSWEIGSTFFWVGLLCGVGVFWQYCSCFIFPIQICRTESRAWEDASIERCIAYGMDPIESPWADAYQKRIKGEGIEEADA